MKVMLESLINLLAISREDLVLVSDSEGLILPRSHHIPAAESRFMDCVSLDM